jgi:ribosomal protein S18 acetylase RimI-like enzyme
MLKAALSRAARRGIWLVELDVFADNARAIGLYEDLGFRKSGITPNKILRDGKARDELHMFIDLRGTDKSTPTARTKR